MKTKTVQLADSYFDDRKRRQVIGVDSAQEAVEVALREVSSAQL